MEVEPTDQEQPSWAKIPILVSANLFALMNYKTKKVARLVCGDWRFAVDHLTGLSLAVDEYRDGKDFLTFLQMVKLCQVTIGNVVALQKQLQWKYPGALRKVVCQGQIQRDWFCNLVLKQCPNLTRLILKGDFLSKLIVDGGAHPSPSPIVCSNLMSLEIISPRGNIFPRHFAMSYYLNVFSDPSTSPRNEVESIQNAVAFILKSIRSPKLTLLNIFVYENFLIHQQEDYWKQTLFEEFLEAHQVSLKELYLHEFRGKRSSKPSLNNRPVPNKLTQMEISIHRYYQVHGNTKLEQDHEFLRRLLSEQTELMDLTIEFHKMRTFWITDVLCNVITNNKNTLRVLKLQIVRCDEDECVLSGILLSELVCLEEFKLEGDALTNNALTLTDFAWLPKSLTKILTMFMRIEETDFTCIHEFKSLKYIELNHIVMGHHDEINLENNTSSIFASILEQLLRHRELDHLGVSLSRSVNSCEKLKNFMERISEASTTPNHQDNEMPNYYGLVIAHQYEIDDKFDLYKSTNRESIFSDDFVFQIRPKKDTVSLVEVRVEVERRDNVDYFEEELTEDNFATSDLTSEGSSGMPSLTPLHLSSDWDEMDPAQGIIMPPDPDEDIS